MAQLTSHPSTFFGTAMTCLCASFTVVNIMPFTFLSTCITNVSAQIAKPLCKLAIHRHQCCRCPTNSSTFPVDLSATCHHLDILFFEVRCGTELTRFSASHASIYAALPFCVLKCCSCSRRHLNRLTVMHSIYRQSTVQIEQSQHGKCSMRLPAQI
jgi:hypothetical protein